MPRATPIPDTIRLPKFAGGRRWKMVLPYSRPLSLNIERQGNRMVHKAHINEYRDAAFVEATNMKIPHLAFASFHVWPSYDTNQLPDCGNSYPTVKAAIDGLVKAKVLPDDGFREVEGFPQKLSLVVSQHTYPPRYVQWNGLVMIVEEQTLVGYDEVDWPLYTTVPRSGFLG